MSKKTFIKITNKDIYDKLNCMEKKQNKLFEQQAVMVEHQESTNGKIKLNTKMTIGLASATFTGFLALIGWIVIKTI